MLVIPVIDTDADTLSAAMKYAEAGLYVLPVRRGTKNPGSVVGKRWQSESSRDPQQIAAAFAGTDHDIAVHAGRSGLVIIDVDSPDKLPDELAAAVATAPYQSTRPDTPGRGHYVLAMPPGRTVGNSTGRLGGEWGDVRGLNGVIIVAPSAHASGGEYRWERVGPVPVLPAHIADQLDDASPASDAASDTAVAAFIAEHIAASRPELLGSAILQLRKKIADGDSRHGAGCSVAAWAMEEAAAGVYAAKAADDKLRAEFVAVMTQPSAGGRRQLTEAQARAEWAGIRAWAVGQALGADLDKRRAHIANNAPSLGTAGTDGTAKSEDGPEVLDDVARYLARFVSFPSTHAQIAYVLWIAHTHLMDAWESTPRIAFLSPEPGSGKTRALEVAEPLVPRPVHAVNCTPAYLFRKVSDEAGPPTILYDEIDTVFGPKAKDNEDTRGMLNAGHRKGATAGRCVMRGKVVETEELPAYCAVALAGLNDLPDTIMTRSVLVRMRRRKPDEKVEPWRGRINGPQGAALGDRLARWADAVRQRASEDWPDMPDSIEDRDADVWEPLLSVADLAGGRWPAVARDAAVALVKASKARTPSLGVQLLRDVRRVFVATDKEKLPTIQLLAELIRLDESPWGVIRKGEPLDSRWLASHLKDYGIESKNHRDEYSAQFKGYATDQFADAWERYLPADDDEDQDDGEGSAAA